MAGEKRVILTQTKVTKNTVRYDTPTDDNICPAIYLKKAHLPSPFPAEVEVTVRWA